MALHHALLSLLASRESYGYELKRRFEADVGTRWGALNIGHVYQQLQRLERDGLVEAVRAESQPRRPDRRVYAISATGRAELDRWLREPRVAAGYRDDLHLKLTAAARAGEDALALLLQRERAAGLVELRALREVHVSSAPDRVLLEGAALQVEARLRLLQIAAAYASELVTSAATAADAGSGEDELRRSATG